LEILSFLWENGSHSEMRISGCDNSLPAPTYEKLDRVLMTTEWEFKFPLVSVRALDRGVLDHTLLLLDMGDAAFKGNSRQFKLELSWFTRDDFYARVAKIWNKPVQGRNSVQRWNRKMSALRSHLRGWATNNVGIYKQQKGNLISTIDKLDVEAESHDLMTQERHDLSQARDQLARLLREEELK
jgi:hypothetical protein